MLISIILFNIDIHTLRNLALVDGDWSGVVALSGSPSFLFSMFFVSKILTVLVTLDSLILSWNVACILSDSTWKL